MADAEVPGLSHDSYVQICGSGHARPGWPADVVPPLPLTGRFKQRQGDDYPGCGLHAPTLLVAGV